MLEKELLKNLKNLKILLKLEELIYKMLLHLTLGQEFSGYHFQLKNVSLE